MSNHLTVGELVAILQTLPAELPVVLTHDCWQWRLTKDEAPKVAQWDGQAVGTPRTKAALEADREHMSDSYVDSYDRPCVAIGYVE